MKAVYLFIILTCFAFSEEPAKEVSISVEDYLSKHIDRLDRYIYYCWDFFEMNPTGPEKMYLSFLEGKQAALQELQYAIDQQRVLLSPQK